ncbi:hypothetical protein I41_02790 [Lacipirellula limnantheis]|uniref:Uncharacterized protein n=1 Tax=Lacipirellula limnantheis TaxID=2528024 RepID=A0A517TRX5_9BACT|nr:hypothetical protein I41_02790 [Lacipirellula limnantheis]
MRIYHQDTKDTKTHQENKKRRGFKLNLSVFLPSISSCIPSCVFVPVVSSWFVFLTIAPAAR